MVLVSILFDNLMKSIQSMYSKVWTQRWSCHFKASCHSQWELRRMFLFRTTVGFQEENTWLGTLSSII